MAASSAPPLDSKFSLRPLDRSSFRSPSDPSYAATLDAIFRDADAVLAESDHWSAGKTFHDGLVYTASRKKREGEKLGWHLRSSKHTDRSYDDFRHALLLNHAETESQYVPDLKEVELVEAIKPGEAEVWHNLYHQPAPATDRDFTLLILSRETDRNFLVVSIPYAHPDRPPQSGHERAAYASVEQAKVVGNEVQWRMVVTSDAGGLVPNVLTDQIMPRQIAHDVPHVLEWMDKHLS